MMAMIWIYRGAAVASLLVFFVSMGGAVSFSLVNPGNNSVTAFVGHNISHAVDVTDPVNGSVSIFVDGEGERTAFHNATFADNTTRVVFHDLMAPGRHTWRAQYVNDTGPAVNSSLFAYNISDPVATIVWLSPEDGEVLEALNFRNVTFSYNAPTDVAGTVRLFIDGQERRTHTVGNFSNLFFNRSTVLAKGNHTARVEFDGDFFNVSANTSTREFRVGDVKGGFLDRLWFWIWEQVRKNLDFKDMAVGERALIGVMVILAVGGGMFVSTGGSVVAGLIGMGVTGIVLPLTPLWPRDLVLVYVFVAAGGATYVVRTAETGGGS